MSVKCRHYYRRVLLTLVCGGSDAAILLKQLDFSQVVFVLRTRQEKTIVAGTTETLLKSLAPMNEPKHRFGAPASAATTAHNS